LKINPEVGVPSTFGFAIFIFQVPERYAYLSGTAKLKCIDWNFTKSGTRRNMPGTNDEMEAGIPKLDFQRTRFRFLE